LAEGQKVVVYSPTPELPKEITERSSAAPKKPTPTKPPVLARNIATAPSKTTGSNAPVKVANVGNNGKHTPPAPVAKPAVNGGKPVAKPAVKPSVPPAAAKKTTPGKR
jgi:hypothetical protein